MTWGEKSAIESICSLPGNADILLPISMLRSSNRLMIRLTSVSSPWFEPSPAMSESFLRPKSPNGTKTRLNRVPSRRSQFLSRFFDQKGDERGRRMSKDELIEKGIYKPEAVFGNDLVSLAHTCFPNHQICVETILPRPTKTQITLDSMMLEKNYRHHWKADALRISNMCILFL